LDGLYLFTIYALPLTALNAAFGSDCLMLLHLGFPLNSAIIMIIVTYENVLSNSGMNFAAVVTVTFPSAIVSFL